MRAFLLLATAMAAAVVAMLAAVNGRLAAPLVYLLTVICFLVVATVAFNLGKGLDHPRLKGVLWAAVLGFLLGVALGSSWSRDAQGGLLALITGPAGWLMGTALGLAWQLRR